VEDREVAELTNVDYAQLFFRLSQRNSTTGYSYIQNYPLPRKDRVYILLIENNQILDIKEVPLSLTKIDMDGRKSIV
jgi:hypothetical protein